MPTMIVLEACAYLWFQRAEIDKRIKKEPRRKSPELLDVIGAPDKI